jgi:hypothetical protein
MQDTRRFVLNKERFVIDTVNPSNSMRAYSPEGAPHDEIHLRKRILLVLLGSRLDKLINPDENHWEGIGDDYPPRGLNWYPMWTTMASVIESSALNAFDPMLSIKHRFAGGPLQRQKNSMRDFVSISLFGDDLECALRDLYGDFESNALIALLYALECICYEFAKYVRPELAKEFDDAVNYEHAFSVPGGCNNNGMKAQLDLGERILSVHNNPSAYSEYTVHFVKHLQRWPGFGRVRSLVSFGSWISAESSETDQPGLLPSLDSLRQRNELPFEPEADETAIEQRLAVRKRAAQQIDPETAEIYWIYGLDGDPYNVGADLPEEYQCIGRQYFARSPESDVWVYFGDLPPAMREALWERYKSKFAIPPARDVFERKRQPGFGQEHKHQAGTHHASRDRPRL